MKINFNTPIYFKSLDMRQINGINFPKDFTCRSNSEKPYNVKIFEDYDSYVVHISDNKFRTVPNAEQEIYLDKNLNYMTVDNMFTEDEFRGEGLGICMHLINVVEMLENKKIKKIELNAASRAIPFHAKLGFKANSQTFRLLDYNLNSVANDTAEDFSTNSQDARMLLKSYMHPELKIKIGNKILDEYISKALKIKTKDEQKKMFKYILPMTLTRDDVIKNKDFYNKLFKKYKIDYEI